MNPEQTVYPGYVIPLQAKPPTRATWICLLIACFFFLLPIPVVSYVLGSSFGFVSFILSIIVISRGATGTGILQIILTCLLCPAAWFIGMAILVQVGQR